jgi:RHS repeat-associated protein
MKVVSSSRAFSPRKKSGESNAPPAWGLTFGYDAWGNLLTSTISGPSGCSEPAPLNVPATAANQISGYCYDAAGNLLVQGTCPTGSNPTYTYKYDSENHLISAAGVNYSYDGDGKRVQKSSGTIYWYGASSDPLDETDLTGSTTNSAFFEYIFFDGERIARRDYQNNVSYYFADHLGTSRIVTNSAGAILDDSDFYPFGVERPVLSTSGNHYKFTGKERDSESGLDNLKKRYYGSNLGRLMSADPVFFQAEMLTDPQRFNEYAYARNNPLLYVDPSGEAAQLSNDPAEQQEQLNAICSAAGIGSSDCSYYIYANKASDGNYYVGIYTNGADGKGTSFQNLNDVAGALGAVINDPRVVQLDVVAAGTMLTDNQGKHKIIGPVDPNTNATPGATYIGQDGKWHIALLDSSTAPGSLPKDWMSAQKPGFLDQGIILAHEMGHIRGEWGLVPQPWRFIDFTLGRDPRGRGEAIMLENKVRKIRDPNAQTRNTWSESPDHQY